MYKLQTTVIAIAASAFGAAAVADTVYLKSGDRASGDLIEFDGEELHLDSDFADEIEIDIEDIEAIETTRPVLVEFDDGREVTGYVVRDADGRMWIQETPPAPEDEEEAARTAEPSGVPLDLANVYNMEEAKTYFSYEASFNLGLNAASGNTDTKNLTVSWDLRPSFGDNHLTFKGQVNRTESDGDTTASNWRLDNQYERELTRKWLLGGLLNFDHDKLQDLNLRTTVGAGAGYKFFEPHPTLLKVLLAPVFVNEDYEQDDERYAGLLWALDFEQDLYTEDLQLYHDHKLTAGLSKSQALLQTTTGLKFELIDDFDLLLEVQVDWNSDPADDAKESDQRYLVKIGYTFEGDENNWWH